MCSELLTNLSHNFSSVRPWNLQNNHVMHYMSTKNIVRYSAPLDQYGLTETNWKKILQLIMFH